MFIYHRFNKKTQLIIGIILFLSTLCINKSFATEYKRPVRVGYYEAPDFQEGAEPGLQKKGYAYEYYYKIAEYTGWQYEYIYGSYDKILELFNTGEIDLFAGPIYEKNQKYNFNFPEKSMGYTNYSIIIRSDESDSIPYPQLLNNKTIGVNGSKMESVLKVWLNDNKINANYVIYNSSEQLNEDLENKKVDAIITNLGNQYIQNTEYISIHSTADFYLCVNKDRSDLLNKLNIAQKELSQEEPGFIENLRLKYFPKSTLSQTFTKSEIDWIKNHHKIRIGYLNNYLPYSSTDKNGEVVGLIKDLLPQLLNQLDLQKYFEINYQGFESVTAMIIELVQGNIDVIFPVGGSLYFAEENGIYKSNPVIDSDTSIVYKKNTAPKQLPVFAINKNNSMQEDFIKSHFPDSHIIYYNSIEACLTAIKKGYADCTTINGLRVGNILRNSKFDSLEFQTLPIKDERSFGIEIGNEGLLKIINKGITCLGGQYILNTAYQYTSSLYKYSFADFIKSNVILFAIVLIIIAGIIFYFMANDNRKKKAYLALETKKNEELKVLHREQQTQLIEIKLLNAALEQSRKNIEKYINDMMRYASSGDDPDSVLKQLLDYLGRNTDGDRIYIFEENENGNFDNTYEWCKNNVAPQIDTLQDVPSSVIDHWLLLFRQSKAVIIRDLEKEKVVYPMMYEILNAQNVTSLVTVPIIINKNIIGFLGVDNPPKESIDTISEFLFLVEFIFSQMIRMRNNTRAIQESAMHDQLTGCQNRKALVNKFNKNSREDISCCIVACDMNGLKQVNDGQGHDAGDKFICRTADTLGDIFGAENVYRIGGDEFTILLFGKTKEEFDALIEQSKLQIGTTASIGYTYIEKLNLSLEEIMRIADMEMYKEKDRFYQKKRVRRNQL